MKYIIIIISPLLLITCNNIEEDKIKQNAHPEVLHVDLEANRPIYMSDVFQDLSYVKLDNHKERLIGDIQKIAIQDSTLFIFEKSTPSIFIYNLLGEFINQIIIPKGKGPGEMIVAKDFVVNRGKRELAVLGHTKLNIYSFEGNLVESQKLKVMPDKIAQLSNDVYALFMNNEIYNSMEIMDKPYNLLYLRNDKIIKRFLPIDKYKADLGFTVPNNFPRYRNNTLLYFHPSYTIYELKPTQISARYILDFDDNNIPPSSFEERKNLQAGHKFVKKTLKEEYASYLANFLETDKLVYFSILWDRPKSYPVFYLKNTNEALVAEKLMNDIDGGLSPYFTTSYKNKLIAHIQSSELLEKVDKLKRTDVDQLNEQQRQLIKFAEDVKPYDNPIIMFGKVKSNLK